MNRFRTIIVDDEPHARNYLRGLLEEDDEIDIKAELKNGREAIGYLQKEPVDIMFLDIQMPGVSGMDVIQHLPGDPPEVIFTTAFDQYAVEAFEHQALDYLLKPFSDERLFASLDRAKERFCLKERSGLGSQLVSFYEEYQRRSSPHLTEVTIKEKGLERTIVMADVLYIEASSVYALLHTQAGSTLYRMTLHELERQLDPSSFVRIHRSLIVNGRHIDRYKYLSNNRFDIYMSNGKCLTSSRSYKQSIQNFLSQRS